MALEDVIAKLARSIDHLDETLNRMLKPPALVSLEQFENGRPEDLTPGPVTQAPPHTGTEGAPLTPGPVPAAPPAATAPRRGRPPKNSQPMPAEAIQKLTEQPKAADPDTVLAIPPAEAAAAEQQKEVEYEEVRQLILATAKEKGHNVARGVLAKFGAKVGIDLKKEQYRDARDAFIAARAG